VLLGSHPLEDKSIGGRKIKRSEAAEFKQMADKKGLEKRPKSANSEGKSAENRLCVAKIVLSPPRTQKFIRMQKTACELSSDCRRNGQSGRLSGQNGASSAINRYKCDSTFRF
jgi:hypothetical protein